MKLNKLSRASLFRKQKVALGVVIISLFSACSSLKPLQSEFKLLPTFSNFGNINEYGKGKVVVYNGAGYFHKSDGSATVNVWINGKALGQLRANEFAVFYLMPDSYDVRMQHKDIGNFENTQRLVVDAKTAVIMIKPTATSNKIEVTNQLPDGFEKYSNLLK